MYLYLVRTDPVQQIAAEPDTLEALTAALSPRTQPPQATPEVITYHAAHGFGWPLVADPTITPGVIHCRPTPGAAPPLSATEVMEYMRALMPADPIREQPCALCTHARSWHDGLCACGCTNFTDPTEA
ncbi:hypothetical protein [Streptomyces sp. rh34]|uniref:hypothetical protein n=1 Tax=Streptomyces sp. rh34 TaxID=2034272 RepID=UPI000BF0CFD0|nr:hypothetical protein [Streptomyces sp. rh34]